MIDISALRELKTLKQNDRQTVILTEDSRGTKYIKRVLSGDKREVYKFLKKISNSHIPKVYEVVFDSDTVILEEYVAGVPLSSFLAEGRKLNQKQLTYICQQILYALEVLHGWNIIHKDIKPDNILIDDSYHVWLTDYDIARIYRKEIRRDTEVMGTFGYAPIEQYGMLPTDFKTDVYAFGVTLQMMLESVHYRGYLQKIAEKCKKVDPSERYHSVQAIKRAMTRRRLRYPLLFMALVAIAAVLFGIFCNFCYSKPQSQPAETNSAVLSEQPMPSVAPTLQPSAEPEKTPNSKTQGLPATSEPQSTENESFEGTFSDFAVGNNEALYQEMPDYSQVCIFGMQTPWEHLIFTDDMTKTGRLKLGKINTVIDAEFTLQDGELSVHLTDPNGKTFQKQFQYYGQYSYTPNYTDHLRNNADIICYDFNGDGATELLIGLNECSMGAVGEQFYCYANYSIAWCVLYDEHTGFQLCNGDMFAKRDSFFVNEVIRKFNVHWEDFSEVTGYLLEGDTVIPD